jgi:hypothetical protein
MSLPERHLSRRLARRLVHHADVPVLEGKSYRPRESELETAARRKKK